MAECHCGKDGHALNSINCPVHGGVTDEIVKRAATGIHRLFVLREIDEPMPSFGDMARAALEAVK